MSTESPRYVEPYELKGKLLAWTELNVNEVDLLVHMKQSQSADELYNFVGQLFQLRPSIPQEKILLDLHYYATKFAIENAFTKIQISSFISIIRALHLANQETPFDNYDQLLKYFHELMICHSVKRPPFCVDVFSGPIVPKVVNYITNSYLRHQKLYKYAFTPIVALNLHLDYVNRTMTPFDEQLLESFKRMNSDCQSKISYVSLDTSQTYHRMNERDADEEEEEQQQGGRAVPPEDRAKAEMRAFVRETLRSELESQKMREKLQRRQSSVKPDSMPIKPSAAGAVSKQKK